MAWPAETPDLQAAERALRGALEGSPAPAPVVAGVASQVVRTLTDLERASLAGASLGFDGAPVRRASAMRVRVGVAFATAPPPGARADAAAVAALLGEIDDLLSEVNALAETASMDLARALGSCRAALVREAIDFSMAAQRYAPAEPAWGEVPVGLPPAGARAVDGGVQLGVLALARALPARALIALAACAAIAAVYGWSVLGH
ncbi:MAG TPA: hypothetical protein VLT47_01410 [Anaeromyxobacteraceae bacterium]|nr:hypothetical protein [Anaeromyxobacteraceae bacterium]